MHNKGTVLLETNRLILRKFDVKDYEKIFNNYCNDGRVAQYVTWNPHINSSETKELVSMWVSRYDDLEFYYWQVALKENNEPIGSLAVVGIERDLKEVELGYSLAYNYWNKGIMTEAVSKVIEFLFEEVQVNKVVARHDSRNIGSGKVMQKCGMQYYGSESGNNKGEDITLQLYAITREDYNNK